MEYRALLVKLVVLAFLGCFGLDLLYASSTELLDLRLTNTRYRMVARRGND